MKIVIKHILSICVLLTIGNSSLFANTLATINSVSAIQGKSDKALAENVSYDLFNIITPVQDFNTSKGIVIDNEEEVTEIITINKPLEKSIPYLSFYHSQAAGFSSDHTNSLAVSFCNTFFYLPSYSSLYIIFEVFRI